MEELKLLVEMVAGLPSLALWVAVLFFGYKVAVIGSVYGVIRFVTQRIHDYLVTKKVEYKEIRPILDGLCIKASTDSLVAQLHRLKGRGITIQSDYIHPNSVDWLREAIDDKIAKEGVKKC